MRKRYSLLSRIPARATATWSPGVRSLISGPRSSPRASCPGAPAGRKSVAPVGLLSPPSIRSETGNERSRTGAMGDSRITCTGTGSPGWTISFSPTSRRTSSRSSVPPSGRASGPPSAAAGAFPGTSATRRTSTTTSRRSHRSPKREGIAKSADGGGFSAACRSARPERGPCASRAAQKRSVESFVSISRATCASRGRRRSGAAARTRNASRKSDARARAPCTSPARETTRTRGSVVPPCPPHPRHGNDPRALEEDRHGDRHPAQEHDPACADSATGAGPAPGLRGEELPDGRHRARHRGDSTGDVDLWQGRP